jgi:hypothetical protein
MNTTTDRVGGFCAKQPGFRHTFPSHKRRSEAGQSAHYHDSGITALRRQWYGKNILSRDASCGPSRA